MPLAEPALLVILISTVAIAYYLSEKSKKEGFLSFSDFVPKPTLWFVLDDFELNRRNWSDFGGRLNKNPNVGFLSLTKTRCIITQGKDFDVKELNGRKMVAHIVRTQGGYVPDAVMQAPSFLWKAWARAALLATAGGLYFEGTGLCLGPSFKGVIGDADALAFGLNHDERYASTTGPYSGWAKGPGHKSWIGLMEMLAKFIDAGPLAWDSVKARNQIVKLENTYLMPFVQTAVTAEWCRRTDGRPIENEDLFGRSLGEGWNPGADVVYVPLDFERLVRDLNFSWFLRMNPEQILDTENSFIWAQLYQKSGAKDELIKL